MTNTCTPSEIISRNVSITYGVLYASLLLIVSIYSFDCLMKFNEKFQISSYVKRLKLWLEDTWKRKRCYVPLVAHLFDQITDIAVAIQFYELAQRKSDGGRWTDCNGLNIWYLLILTILSMIIYRGVSSYLIYHRTKSIQRFVFQIFDLELFRTLYINYLCNKTEPCDPQRWLTALEAALESTPQALVQLIYLVKTETFSQSYLVVISLLSSFWSIISKLVSDDKIIVVENAKRSDSKFTMLHYVAVISSLILLVVFFIIVTIPAAILACLADNTDCQRRYNFDGLLETFSGWIEKIISMITKYPYALRVVWRILDISSHILLMVFVWIGIGGTALTVKVLFECIVFLCICIKTQKWEMLFGLVAIIKVTSKGSTVISSLLIMYRIMSNIIFMILITIFLFVPLECVRCTRYDIREKIVSNPILLGVFVYTWCAVILNCVSFYIMEAEEYFEQGKSNSRDLKEMIHTNNVDGILETQLYQNQYGIYDEEQKSTLLMLAMKENKVAVVWYLLNKLGYENCDTQDVKGENMLDWYCEGHKPDSGVYDKKRQTMMDILQRIHEEYPRLVDKEGRNAILCGCYCKEKGMIDIMTSFDESVILSGDKTGHNFCNYLWDDMDRIDALEFYKKYPGFLSRDCHSPFFYQCAKGNGDIVYTLLERYPDLVNRNDGNNHNILDYYFTNQNVLTDDAILYINKLVPSLKSNEKEMSLFLCIAKHGNVHMMDELLKNDPNCYDTQDKDGNGIIFYSADYLYNIDCFEFYKKYPETVLTNGNTPFFSQCAQGNGKNIFTLLKQYPQLIHTTDNSDENILQYYIQNRNVLTDEAIMYINELNSTLRAGLNQCSLFLCVSFHGNIECAKKLIQIDQTVLQHKDNTDFNAATLAQINGQQQFVEYLQKSHEIAPLTKNEIKPTFLDILIESMDPKDHLIAKKLIWIHSMNPSFRSENGKYSPFLCACLIGNLEAVKALINVDKNVLNDTVSDSDINGAIIAMLNNQEHIVDYFKSQYNINPKISTNKRQEYDKQKIVILGPADTGKSVLFRQFVMKYGKGYESFAEGYTKSNIIKQIIHQMHLCVEMLEELKEHDDYKHKQLQLQLSPAGIDAAFIIDKFKNINASYINSQIANAIDTLWNEDAIKMTYEARHEIKFHCADSAPYFWGDIHRFADDSYLPTVKDILLQKYETSSIMKEDVLYGSNKYVVVDYGGSRYYRRKWGMSHMLDDVSVVLFVVSLSSFNELEWNEENNAMVDALQLWNSIVNNTTDFIYTPMILVLNKSDLFKEVIKTTPITVCPSFTEFKGNPQSFKESVDYIKSKFMEQCALNHIIKKSVKVHITSAIEEKDVCLLFRDVVESIQVYNNMQGNEMEFNGDEQKEQENQVKSKKINTEIEEEIDTQDTVMIVTETNGNLNNLKAYHAIAQVEDD
eukprot:539064_1